MNPIHKPTSPGSALVITLAILVLVTILAVGMISMARLERISARNALETVKAKTFSDAAADHALALIRDAIFAAESTAPNTSASSRKFWASQPGKITVFNSDGTVDAASSRALYSTNTDPAAETVDLNAAPFGGGHPILTDDGSGTAPEMKVPWVNVLKNPTQPASATNTVIGRYAFWVDDESTKLNVNTADGSAKGATNSFGAGSPSEMNLQVLTNASMPLTAAEARNIARQSGAQFDAATASRPYNSVREVLQASGVSSNLFNIHAQDLTAYNRAPELNIFGEPRIYLTPVTGRMPGNPNNATSASPFNTNVGIHTPLSLITGPYANVNPASPAIWSAMAALNMVRAYAASGDPRPGNQLTWIYPSSGKLIQADPTKVQTPPNSQLPPFVYKYIDNNGAPQSITARLPQFFHEDGDTDYSAITSDYDQTGYVNKAHDYDLGYRIARYLKGFNSQGNPINWPLFAGSGTGGFAAKYTDRQIDDMTCQLLSMLKQMNLDHYNLSNSAYYIRRGFISGKQVRGFNRAPRLNEIIIAVDTLEGDPPLIKIKIVLEWVLPKGFKGYDLVYTWRYSVNKLDVASATNPSNWLQTPVAERAYGITPGELGSGYWADNMLKVLDQNGNSAGVDLMGTRAEFRDLDQAKAALYHHPWALKDPALPHDPNTNPYMGGGPTLPPGALGLFYSPLSTGTPVAAWKPGEYHTHASGAANYYFKMKSGTTAIKLSGGLAVWAKGPSGHGAEIVPLESGLATGANAIAAVIPIPDGPAIPIPGGAVYHIQVADPLVNSFQGDWEGEILPNLLDPKITMQTVGGEVYTNGQNTLAKPSAGGDEQTAWWPEQNLSIPKSQRFPSTGYLQYLHTGTMPDKDSEQAAETAKAAGDPNWRRKLKGTPYRLLNFSPSTAASQQTAGGQSFPDWAMLDLFTTPAIFQPLGNPPPDPIIRTWAGATAGRINPNAVLEPFGILRTKPLEALFKGLTVSTSYDTSGNPTQTTVDSAALAAAVANYVKGLARPLMLPGEICNLPEVANNVSSGMTTARSRNDLVRQTVGNLTTRSNTFTIWAIGEVIRKKTDNPNYATFEPGDIVLGRSRTRYTIERYLDPGTDGIYGNSVNSGPDGVVNTPDDPVTTAPGAHPSMAYPLPYKYRIIEVSQVE